jgi:hypothetical protein
MKKNSVKHWAVGVTTAPRPQSMLEQTLASFRRAGWTGSRVFDDVKGSGAWRNWIDGLKCLVEQDPNADAYLMIQDDAVFCRGLRAYLERMLWPADRVALCSPYSPTPYKKPQRGWHEENRGWNLVGAVCWALPPDSARTIVAELGHVEARNRIDARIGQWARQARLSVWYHTPSLVQHSGLGNSALGDMGTGSLRVAADFPGEDVEP